MSFDVDLGVVVARDGESAFDEAHGRFEALFEGAPTPEAVLATPVDALRGAGLSANKAASILG